MGMCSRASTTIQLCNSSPSFPNGCPFASNGTSIRSPFVLTTWILLIRVALRLPSSSGLNLERPRLTKYTSVGTGGSIGTGVGAATERGRRGSEGEEKTEGDEVERVRTRENGDGSQERQWREDAWQAKIENGGRVPKMRERKWRECTANKERMERECRK
ncbi:hypothetical protein TIFTF001_016431 [Ficus carica]|uniref:Uncharacterized protein n=1 Tax=Ficus carica TaxID=3494 RepID=A0AA88A0B9_FICCA|nr:hypothetical protein TIFTF001_016431 [Ficus carica]